MRSAENAMHRRTSWPSAAIVIRAKRVDTDGIVMRDLISAAYGIEPERIRAPGMTGIPRLSQLRYAIHAIMPQGSTKGQLPEMLRALLEERFHLQVHREVTDEPAYALETKKRGTELNKPREMDRTACENWLTDPSFPDAEMCSSLQVIGGRNVVTTMESDSRFGPWEARLDRGSFRSEFFKTCNNWPFTSQPSFR